MYALVEIKMKTHDAVNNSTFSGKKVAVRVHEIVMRKLTSLAHKNFLSTARKSFAYSQREFLHKNIIFATKQCTSIVVFQNTHIF
jgi:hypothetical protein